MTKRTIKGNPVPTETEYQEWLQHPVTQAFRLFLLQYQDSLRHQWIVGQCLEDTCEKTALLNAKAAGSYIAIQDLIELDYQNFEETISEG